MIALIGAGPLGIEMAVALKRGGIPYVHFEAGQVGATMAWWTPGTRWFSSNERIAIAGVPLVTPMQEKATREEYLAYLRGIVELFALDVQTYRKVLAIEKRSGGFRLRVRHALIESAPEQTVDVEKVILVTGGTASPNLLGVPGEELPHVSHYFQDPHAYFGQSVLIVGGRNSAVEAALRCYRVGAKVHFSYRGEDVDARDIKYWLYPEFSGLVKAGKIIGHFQTRVENIAPDTVTLAPATGEGPRTHLAIDMVLAMTGYQADLSLAQSLGVALQGPQAAPVFNPDTMETTVPGLYIAGTAIAGTQRRYKVFLENCHTHVDKILAHLTGHIAPATPAAPEILERPES